MALRSFHREVVHPPAVAVVTDHHGCSRGLVVDRPEHGRCRSVDRAVEVLLRRPYADYDLSEYAY
jgi:hypothetical protein